VLEITDIPYISPDLSGLSSSSFALPEQTTAGTKGQLAHAWLALDAQPKTLPDDHHLFTMRFKAIGGVCSLTDFDFLMSNIPTVEVLTNNFEEIGAVLKSPTILVTGPGCSGFTDNMACNDFTNVSLSPFGTTQITAEMILEGGPYDYSVMEVSPSELDCSDLGAPVVVTVSNTSNGNSCWGEVELADLVPPVVILEQELVVTLSQSGSANPFTATVSVDLLDEGSYDACSSQAELVFEPATFEFDCTDLGEQQVFVTVTDGYGNQNSAFSTIVVEMSEDLQIVCPANVVVDCETDINDPDLIESVLGAAFTNEGCVPVYEDSYGYDQNNDGDRDDEYTLNGETISEEYYNDCMFGTVLRVWSIPGSNSACQQIIGLNNVGSTFDGDAMIDWPFSQDEIIAVADNDGGSCSNLCGQNAVQSIEIVYDNDGNPVGANITANCRSILCEEPFWESSLCSFIGWGAEETITELGNGVTNIVKEYSVVDACQYDDVTGEGRWSWTVNATIDTGIPDEVTLALSDVSAANGETVCVPVRVYNFQNIESVQASINWDASVARFRSIGDFGLPGLNNGSFGINNINNGKLSFVWFDDTTNNPATLPDGSILFNLCFDVTGEEGDNTVVELTGDPTAIELTSMNSIIPHAVLQGSIFVGEGNCTEDLVKPVPYCVNGLTAELDNGSVEVWAIDFDVASFDNCTSSEDLRFTFSSTNPDQDPNFTGNSSSRIYTQADLAGPQTVLTVDVYVWDESDNKDFCRTTLTLKEDSANSETVFLYFDEQYGAPGSEVCVPLMTDNFTNVEAAQATLEWNADVLTYSGIQNAILPGFSPAGNINTGLVGDGKLPFIWFDNSGMNPATYANGTVLFEVCFELTGQPGESSALGFSGVPTPIQVSRAGEGAQPVAVEEGSVTILDSDCQFMVTDIAWPTAELNVFVEGVTPSNISQLMSPNALLAVEGIDSSDVFPEVLIEAFCQNLIGVAYDDTVFEEGGNQFRIVRNWTLLDWLTGQAYTFTQVIKNYVVGGLICDFLPNSAPIGDCASGHTLDDDVEWPDDLEIADHRISPDELEAVLGIEYEDTRPVLYNNPSIYELEYVDFLGELSQTELKIEREWTLSRTGIVGQNWVYIQNITVDLTDFGKLVTVNTNTFRPVPDVVINSNTMTNQDGIAYTEEDVDPTRLDQTRNGINIRDLILAQSHVLGMMQLDEIQALTADINDDQLVSTLDLLTIEQIILSYESDLREEWVFSDQTDESSAGVAPKAHYIAYKPGDIDDSAELGGEQTNYMTATLMIQDQLLNAGEVYEVPMYITGNIEALATELHLLFDAQMVDIRNVSSQQSFEEVSFNIINGNRLSMVTKNGDIGAQLIDSLNSFVTLTIEALEDGTLKNVFGLSDTNESFILDSDMELILIEDFFEGEITTSTLELTEMDAFKVYPNPVVDKIQIKCSTCAGESYTFELWSMDGSLLLRERNPSEIDVSLMPSGVFTYRILNSEGMQSGKLIKTD